MTCTFNFFYGSLLQYLQIQEVFYVYFNKIEIAVSHLLSPDEVGGI